MSGEDELVAALLAALGRGGAAVRRMDHGMSGDIVARIEGRPALYAKLDGGRFPDEFAHEAAVLAWLDGRCGAPQLVWRGAIDGRPAMAMAAIEGTPLHALAPDAAAAGAVAALGALAALHALPVDDCPFDQRIAKRLAIAERRVAAEDLVVAHGDACWPNFILKPDGGVGLIDLGRFGVADRYQDLALFIRSAGHNFPDLPVRDLVRSHYPADELSDEKLIYYKLLDEFF